MSTILNEVKNAYIEDVKKELVEEGMELKEIDGILTDINENFESDLAERYILTEGVADSAKKIWSAISKIKVDPTKLVKAAGIGIALAAAAFVLYKAVVRKFDACVKSCGKDKRCLAKCRMNYQKGLIATLKKNKMELKKLGKLSDRKAKSIDKAIAKAEAKMKKYEEQYNKLK